MRAVPEALRARLATGVTTLAHVWRLTRRDGGVFGFTDHDRVLVVDGLTCAASTGFRAGAIKKDLDAGADVGRIEGALSAAEISNDDLARGLWDGARVDVFRVDWTDPSLRVHLFAGRLGAVRQGPAVFLAELCGLDAALDGSFGRVYSRFCDAEVGDLRCGVDLSGLSYLAKGAVTSVLDARTFRVDGLAAFADGWFTRGRISWAGGGSGEIAAHRAAGDEVTLELSGVSASVAAGDAFTATAGCDKRATTCRGKFANMVNFRGFPHMPGNDALIAGPDQRAPMDGGSRNLGR